MSSKGMISKVTSISSERHRKWGRDNTYYRHTGKEREKRRKRDSSVGQKGGNRAKNTLKEGEREKIVFLKHYSF